MMTDDQMELSLDFLNQKPLLRVASLVCHDRGHMEIMARREDGLLMRDSDNSIVFLCADSDETALSLLEALPDCQILVHERVHLTERIRQRYQFTWETPANNVVYEKKEPVPVDPDFALRPLSMAQFDLVRRHYTLIGDDGLAFHMKQGHLLGGYAGEELVGFIGRHEEGSLGMLFVFPHHRRKGYAWQLEGHLINRVLAQGERVFGQVILGNDASLALQIKMGLTLCEEPINWQGK